MASSGESIKKLLVEISHIDDSTAYRPNKGEKGSPPRGSGIRRTPTKGK